MQRDCQLLAKHASTDLVALSGSASWTAGDLIRHATALSRQLPQVSGAREVLVLCADRYCFAVSLVAAWMSGASVALPPNAQPETVRELLKTREIEWLLHDGQWESGLDVRALLVQGSTPAASFASITIPADRHLATVYTSGSTGARKACPKTAMQLLGEAALQGETFELTGADRVLATVPSQHIYGLLFGVLMPLTSGAAFVCGTPLHAEAVAARVRESGATVLASVPAHLRGLSTLADGDLRGVRQIVSSGAPLDNDSALPLVRFGARITEVLGSSETGGIAYRHPPDEWWQPLPGLEVRANEEGKLLLVSPFIDGDAPRPYIGADRIELASTGSFRHLGRADGVVKIAGKRVSLLEMEQRLRALPGVLDAAVTAVTVASGRGNEIWAAIVAPSLASEAIRKALLQWFDPVVLPRRLRLVRALPREATGKLTQQRLLSLFEGAMTTGSDGRRDFDVQSRRKIEDAKVERHEIVLGVPADLYYLRGHFENYPILAAVVILNNIVLAEAQRAWPELNRLVKMSRLKFRRPIFARETITMRLDRVPGESTVTFSASVGDKECNSGQLIFEAAA